MVPPSEIDTKILARFDALISRTQNLIGKNGKIEGISAFEIPNRQEFAELQTNAETLVELIFGHRDRGIRLVEKISKTESTRMGAESFIGLLRGLKGDYQAGLLRNLSDMIQVEIASDYMGQANQLLGEGIPGRHDYVPAAVLAGAVLEDALRKLCHRQTPPIDIQKEDGSPKTLEPLIAELQRINVFNKAKADMLRSWAKIRNYAAHGEFKEFKRADVEPMIEGVKQFLADHM